MNIETKYVTIRLWKTFGAFGKCKNCLKENQYRIYRQRHLYINFFGKTLYIDWCYKKVY